MPIRLDARAPGFAEEFRAFLDTKREASADVEQAVRAIIADVAARGDAALIELTKKFDRVDLGAIGMRVANDQTTILEIPTWWPMALMVPSFALFAAAFNVEAAAVDSAAQ